MQSIRYHDLRHVKGEATHIDVDNGVVEAAGTSFFDRAILRVLGKKGWGAVTIDNFSNLTKNDFERLLSDAGDLAAITDEVVELAEAPRKVIRVPSRKENPEDVDLAEKRDLLLSIERAARLPDIVNTRGNYTEQREVVA
ncbi:MAG TPA: DNA gyrase modulator, partial [Methanomicrobiales archaeon]|nr:DNA gyrase modulator [Methanomicrobiales archaeon]